MSILVFIYLRTANFTLPAQSVLAKFKEMNEVLFNSKEKLSFTINETGSISVNNIKNKKVFSYHFTDIDSVAYSYSKTYNFIIYSKKGRKIKKYGKKKDKKTLNKLVI